MTKRSSIFALKSSKTIRLKQTKKAFSTALNCYKHDCLATRVAKTGEPVAIGGDMAMDPRITDIDRILTKISSGSTICAPLKVGEDVIGVIAAWCEKEIKFFPDEIRLFLALTNQMSIIIDNARLFEADKEKINRLMVLQEAVSEMNASYSLDNRILEIASKSALKIANADKVFSYVWEVMKNRCFINDGRDIFVESKEAADKRIESSIIKKAVNENTIVIRRNLLSRDIHDGGIVFQRISF